MSPLEGREGEEQFGEMTVSSCISCQVCCVPGAQGNLSGFREGLKSRLWDEDKHAGNLLGNGLGIKICEGREGREQAWAKGDDGPQTIIGGSLGWSTCHNCLRLSQFGHLSFRGLGNLSVPGNQQWLVTVGPPELGRTCKDILNRSQGTGPLYPGMNHSLDRGRAPNPKEEGLRGDGSLQLRATSGEGLSWKGTQSPTLSAAGGMSALVLKGQVLGSAWFYNKIILWTLRKPLKIARSKRRSS